MLIHVDNKRFLRKLSQTYDETEIKMQMGRLRSKCTRRNISINELAACIQNGQAFICGSIIDSKAKSLEAWNVHNFYLFGLDIDNKTDIKITSKELVSMIKEDLGITPVIYYQTYSSTAENPKFRLLYALEKPIRTTEEFKDMYNRLKYLYPNYIDLKCGNSNRIWNGTNKKVSVNPNSSYVTEDFFEKLKEKTDGKYKIQGEKVTKKSFKIDYNPIKSVEIKADYKFNWQFKEDIIKLIKDSINIEEFLIGEGFEEFGRSEEYVRGICPFHVNADNPHGFLIDTSSQKAFCMTHECTGGDVVDITQNIYSLSFVDALKKLIQDFNIVLPSKYFLNSHKTNLKNKFLHKQGIIEPKFLVDI